MPATSHPDRPLYVGLMSGTSLDAVDAALVRVDGDDVQLLDTRVHPLPESLRADIVALCQPGDNEIDRAGHVHLALGEVFAEATLKLLEKAGTSADRVRAIGSHGQTVRHRPGRHGFSLQLGSADVIAERTGITVVADFRNRDMVLGGQGAPLAPRFHQILFAQSGQRAAVVNIGGMANVTLLDGQTLTGGYDTGPGNALLNGWCQRHREESYDRDGAWAACGHVDKTLLEALLDEPYFAMPAPKSTGRELFNERWLEEKLAGHQLPTEDVQATLVELTATSITDALTSFAPGRILVCGGGAHNGYLMSRLAAKAGVPVSSTAEAGMDPDWIEAAAFAWLAHARLHGIAGNAPAVTGARRGAVLGAVYPA